MKSCSSCGLIHPNESEICECGFNFVSGERPEDESWGLWTVGFSRIKARSTSRGLAGRRECVLRRGPSRCALSESFSLLGLILAMLTIYYQMLSQEVSI
jgi:hypothetical protein